MRLLTTACCTLTFISIPGFTALANPVDNYLLESSSKDIATVSANATSGNTIASLAEFSTPHTQPQLSVSTTEQVVSINQNALIEQKSDLISRYQGTNKVTSLVETTIQANKDLVNSEEANISPSVDEAEIKEVLTELEEIKNAKPVSRNGGGSPGISIVNPLGFGADGNRFYFSPSFQSALRFNQSSADLGLGLGAAFGNARKSVGLELGYALASFGINSDRAFGSGGFNVKLHRQLNPSTAVALGWNGFLNLGDSNDFQDSIYGVVTKIFRTREDINSPFSRIALSGGIGSGQFQEDGDGIGVFAGAAVRIARPISFITEWTGQDLAMGMSIAPFKNIPISLTPGFRDIAGAGDGARFVLGTGIGFSF
jgi:hypothetical protein